MAARRSSRQEGSSTKSPHEIRRGLIKVRIWQRRSKKGVRYSLAVVRIFRNGDQWKESTRLGRDDIPLVRLVLDEAYAWILSEGEGI